MSSPPHDHLTHVTPDEHDAPDAWHQHSAQEKPQHSHGEVANARLIIGVGALMSALLVATVVIVYGYYTWYTTKLLDKQELANPGNGLELEAREYKGRTLDDFQGYHWVAEDAPVVPADTVQIPIDIAKKKVAAQYAARHD